jgi:acyl carrier protein
MTNAEVEAALIEAIRECLEASGKAVDEITSETIPLENLNGFDSLCAVEVLVEIETRFGLTAESDVFVDGTGSKASKRTIKEIAEVLNHK